MDIKGYGAGPTGLLPRYPRDSVCPALAALHGSVVGTEQTERQRGVAGGRVGDAVIAPADGTIVAVWETGGGRGKEWALLMSHAPADVNMSDDRVSHLSQFDRLEGRDLQNLQVGARIERGQEVARVRHSAGVRWQVYEIIDAAETDLRWTRNRHGTDAWTHASARPIDPLYMLSRNQRKETAGPVDLVPFTKGNDFSDFAGFTYIFECKGPPAND